LLARLSHSSTNSFPLRVNHSESDREEKRSQAFSILNPLDNAIKANYKLKQNKIFVDKSILEKAKKPRVARKCLNGVAKKGIKGLTRFHDFILTPNECAT
jgi:hypothetical protein